MTIERLVRELRRPMFNFNMAVDSGGRTTVAQIRSAATRRTNAETEIHELVMKYARSYL